MEMVWNSGSRSYAKVGTRERLGNNLPNSLFILSKAACHVRMTSFVDMLFRKFVRFRGTMLSAVLPFVKCITRIFSPGIFGISRELLVNFTAF